VSIYPTIYISQDILQIRTVVDTIFFTLQNDSTTQLNPVSGGGYTTGTYFDPSIAAAAIVVVICIAIVGLSAMSYYRKG